MNTREKIEVLRNYLAILTSEVDKIKFTLEILEGDTIPLSLTDKLEEAHRTVCSNLSTPAKTEEVSWPIHPNIMGDVMDILKRARGYGMTLDAIMLALHLHIDNPIMRPNLELMIKDYCQKGLIYAEKGSNGCLYSIPVKGDDNGR